MRRGLLIVAVVVVAVALTGCSSTEQSSAPSSQPATSPTSRGVTQPSSPTTDTSSSADNPYGILLAAAPPGYVTVVPDQYLANPESTNVIYRAELPSADAGPTQYAEGTAIMSGGKVVAYRVASGDIYDFICKRFGLSNDGYILAINSIRRGSSAQLFAGDVLNLSPFTMTRYGTVDGKVQNNPAPSPMPTQQP